MVLILLLNLALACNEKEIICQTICKADGDELGVLVKGQCICGNKRELGQYVYKVAVKGTVIKDRKYYDQ